VLLPGNGTLNSFLIAKYEATQAEYAAVMAGHPTLSPNPSRSTGDGLPVEQVSWWDLKSADGFLARTGLSLPTEAQWEYACRGGTTTAFSWGDECNARTCDSCDPAVDYMWWCGNAGGTPHLVGEKLPNPFGLHDMHGNVWEWCEDEWIPGTHRNRRGGSYFSIASQCLSARRVGLFPYVRTLDVGFRPAMLLRE